MKIFLFCRRNGGVMVDQQYLNRHNRTMDLLSGYNCAAEMANLAAQK
jgi:hypothetical protein